MSAVRHAVDRAGWPAGPWDNETDREEWRDAKTGLPCLAVRSSLGAWCGYVGIAPKHPHYEWDHDALDYIVHGGLTYSAKCGGLCDLPAGEADALWWLGFDCAHFGDVIPSVLVFLDSRHGSSRHGSYRTIEYVRDEVAQLAEQIAEAGNVGNEASKR